MTTVSVLLAVYNGVPHVTRAIDSVLGQTHSDFELIVVDDGSTDSTPEIVGRRAAADSRIRLIRSPENRGLAAALNEAFAASKGDLLARIDADDVMLPRRLELQLGFLDDHPDIDVLGSSAAVGIGPSLRIESRAEQHREIVALIYRQNPFIHPSVMMRRRFLAELGGYDERYRRAQDYDLWLRGYRRFRYHNIPEALIEYTMPSKATWASSSAGARAVFAAGVRDRQPVRGAWFAARLLAAFALWKMRAVLRQ